MAESSSIQPNVHVAQVRALDAHERLWKSKWGFKVDSSLRGRETTTSHSLQQTGVAIKRKVWRSSFLRVCSWLSGSRQKERGLL